MRNTPVSFPRTNNEFGHLVNGTIICEQQTLNDWLMYHIPCAKSQQEKLAVMDALFPLVGL